MKNKLPLLILLLLWHTPAYQVLATESSSGPDTAVIEEMIRALGDSRYAVRRDAAQKLRRAGYIAVPALEVAAHSDDPEVALAVRELLPDARLGLGPSWPADLTEQARRIDQLPQIERAALLRQVMNQISDPDAIIQFLLARLAAGNQDEAAAILSEAMSIGDADLAQRVTEALKPPMNDGQAAMLAWSWLLKGQPKDALSVLAECGADSREVRRMRALVIDKGLESLKMEWRHRRHEKLLAEAAAFAAAVNDEARFIYLQALALSAMERSAEAGELVKKAMELNPGNEAAHYAAGEMLMELDQYGLAAWEWQRILEIPPEGGVYDMNAHLRLGRIMALNRDYAAAAQHYGTVLQQYRDGTADGALAGMTLEGLEKMVRELEARATAQNTDGSNQSGRKMELEVKMFLINARAEDLRQALAAAVAQLRLNIQPAGLKISDMQELFVLRYDPVLKEAGFFLGGSACGKPVRLDFEEETASVAVTQLDCVYFYKVSRHGGQAALAAQFEFDYDVRVIADEHIRDYTSSGLKVGDKTFEWKALQEGVRMDWLPEQFVIELEGVSPQGAEERLHYTLPAFSNISAWLDLFKDEERKQ